MYKSEHTILVKLFELVENFASHTEGLQVCMKFWKDFSGTKLC